MGRQDLTIDNIGSHPNGITYAVRENHYWWLDDWLENEMPAQEVLPTTFCEQTETLGDYTMTFRASTPEALAQIIEAERARRAKK